MIKIDFESSKNMDAKERERDRMCLGKIHGKNVTPGDRPMNR